MLNTISVLTHATWETLAISVPAVILAQRGKLTQQECDEKLGRWSGRLLDYVQIDLQVRGLEHLEGRDEPWIVVSNHQSLYDIPVLFQALPLSLRMAAKKELFGTPVWGSAMRVAGFVEIDRKNRARAYDALNRACETLREKNISLHVAPEGTRSKTGALGPFKRGAFELAFAGNFPVLPVCISGAYRVHRSGTCQISRGETITVTVLPALAPSDYQNAGDLRDAAHSVIARALAPQNVMPV